MIREDPPDYNRTSNAWQREADKLRSDPGVWYVVEEYPIIIGEKWDRGGSRAYDINSGRLRAFRPKGSFEAKSGAVNPTTRKVWARYIGEHGEYAEG